MLQHRKPGVTGTQVWSAGAEHKTFKSMEGDCGEGKYRCCSMRAKPLSFNVRLSRCIK